MSFSGDDWSSIGKLFDGQEALCAPKPSYGCDGPVTVSGMSPGMIGPPIARKASVSKGKPKADPNEIFSEQDVLEVGDVDDVDDGRSQPEYELVFKQRVTPEDYFLGVDPLRHPGISCSDDILLKVTLPETQLSNIDLDVRSTFVRVHAPRFKLKVQLPEKVDENKGNAKWDANLYILTVTLPIIHDWDSKMPESKADELD